ncbi:MAG TPA: MFS transporter [Anaerolineae bacterium]
MSFVEKHYRYNFAMNLLDGGFFSLGLAFWSATTVLPLYVSHLSAAPWVISLVAAITQAGWFLPQLLTARRVGGLTRRLPFVLQMTLHERLPVLLLGLSILLWPRLPAPAGLAIFFVLLFWQSSGGGLTAPGWVDLVARVIPLNRRGRLLGFTNLAGSALGALGAILVAYFLRVYDYPRGFAYTFCTGAVAFALSYVFLAFVREPAVENLATQQPRRDFWRSLPAVLRSEPNLRRYLLARVPGIFGVAANGFLAVYAVQRFGLSDQAAGGYTAALMLSGALANPVLGLLGDRLGHKVVMELSLAAQALALAIALLAPAADWFFLVFILQGVQGAGAMIAIVSIAMEFGSPAERPTIVGLANTTQGLFYMIAPPLAGLLAGVAGYRAAFWASLAACGLALLAFRLIVAEPRRHGAGTVPYLLGEDQL